MRLRNKDDTQTMKEKLVVGFLSLLFVASIVVAVMTTLKAPERRGAGIGTTFAPGADGYGVVYLDGLIKESERGGVLGYREGAEDVMANLRWMAKTPRVKAVVLRINSPGGNVGATQEIFQEVAKLSEKKPVVVSVGELCASGGYYIACGAKKIVAPPGSTVGSIGVIAMFPNVQGLLNDKLGVKMEVLTSSQSKMKDSGSPFRPMDPQEKERFQAELDAVYKQFFEVVKAHRSDAVLKAAKSKGFDPALSDEQLLNNKLADLARGQTFTGEAAKAEGLIDDTGNFYDAVNAARKLVGLNEKAPMIVPQSPASRFLDMLFSAGSPAAEPTAGQAMTEMADRLTSARMEYLYLPGGLLK